MVPVAQGEVSLVTESGSWRKARSFDGDANEPCGVGGDADGILGRVVVLPNV